MKYKEFISYLSSGQENKAKQEFMNSVKGKVIESNLMVDNLLKEAVIDNNLKAVRFLINECGVNVNWKVDNFGNKALHFVNDVVTAQVLVSAGASILATGADLKLPLHLVKDVNLAKVLLNSKSLNAVDITGNTPLHTAAFDGRSDIVRFLLGKGADINLLNRNKQTALHSASSEEVAGLLIEAGISVDARDAKGRTALHLSNNVELSRYLLSKGASIEAKDNLGETPLHHAMNAYSKKPIAKFLILADADIYSKDINGKLPIHKVKSLEIGQLLFRYFPEYKNMVDTKDAAGKTPLQYAITKGQKSLALLFVHSGADVNQKGDDGKSLLHLAYNRESVDLLISKKIEINTTDQNGKTPLYDSLLNGHEVVAGTLINCGANLAQEEKDFLLANAAIKGHFAVLKLLCQQGANVTQLNDAGKNLTYLALHNNKVEIAEFLLERGVTISAEEKDFLLHLAATEGYLQVAALLIEQGANLQQLGDNGKTLLYLALNRGQKEVSKLLVQKGLKLTMQEEELLVQEAIKHGNNKLIELLVDSTAFDINKPDSQGKVPLHYAVEKGDMRQVGCFLEKGAVIDLVNKDELLSHTIKEGHNQVAKWLIGKGVDIDKALVVAVSSGNYVVTEALIKLGANILQLDDSGNNLLCHAASPKIANLLISKSPELKNQVASSGKVALITAIKNNNKEVAELFVNQGMEISQEEKNALLNDAITFKHHGSTELLINYGAHVNQLENNPLHTAAKCGNMAAAKLLLSKGGDIRKADKTGKMAVEYAAGEKITEFLAFSILKDSIAQYKVDKDFHTALSKLPNINARDEEGKTILIHAATRYHGDSINQILTKSPDLNIADDTGKNALYYLLYGAAYGYQCPLELAQMLINKGAKLEDIYKAELLRSAALKDMPEIAEILYKMGANIQEAYLFHHAGGPKIVNWALGKKVDINQVDSSGKNALHSSLHISRNYSKIPKILLDNGIRIEEEDKNGFLEIAADNRELAQILIQRGADVRKTNALTKATTVEQAKWLIGQGANLHAISKDHPCQGKNALYVSLINGNIELAEFFSREKELKLEEADKPFLFSRALNYHNYQKAFNFFTSQGVNLKGVPLFHNVYRYPEIVEWLIKNKADVSATQGECTALGQVVYYHYSQVAQLLIKSGIKISAEEKVVALCNTIDQSWQDMFELLLNYGPNLSADQMKEVFVAAISYGKMDIANTLLALGVDVKKGCILHKYGPNLSADQMKEVFVAAISYGKMDIAKTLLALGVDVKKGCILHKAHTVEMIKWLISLGVDVNAIDEYGHNALYCEASKQNDRSEVLRLLMDTGLTLTKSERAELLENSMYGGNVDYVKKLVNIFGVDLATPGLLHKVQEVKIAQYLIEQGVDVNGLNDEGKNPLSTFLYRSYIELALLVYRNGARFAEEDKMPLLERAVINSWLGIIEILIKEGVNLAQSGALHSVQTVAMAKWLIERGADLYFKKSNGQTAIAVAAANNRLDMVKFYLDKGARFESAEAGELLIAAVNNSNKVLAELLIGCVNNIKELCVLHKAKNVQMAKWLLDKGADLNLKDGQGITALGFAIGYGCSNNNAEELVKFWLQKGLKFREDGKLQLLKLKVSCSSKEMTQLIIKHYGVNVRETYLWDSVRTKDMAEWLISQGDNIIHMKDDNNKGALYHSVCNCAPEVTRFLLGKELRFDEPDLNNLLLKAAGNQHKELVEILISQGASIAQTCVLHVVYDKEMAKWLIEKGANVHLRDEDGKTALYKVTYNYPGIDTIKFFLKQGLEFGAADMPVLLDRAVSNFNHRDVANLLVQNGGNIKQPYLLHKAKGTDMLRWLLGHGANPDEIDQDGNTPLHYAVKNKNHKNAKMLIEKMSSNALLAKNSEGKTALHYANDNGNKSVISEIMLGLNLGGDIVHDQESFDYGLPVVLSGNINIDS
jgi:ankyrin repeat protein